MTTKQFDDQLLQIAQLKRMPQMIPWVGENYGKDYKKVLFLGESHYLPESSNLHLDANAWYNFTKENLNSDEVFYTTTRDALWLNHKKNQIWRDTSAIMHKCGVSYFDENKNIFDHFAFYNFFQRPGNEGDQLFIDRIDIMEANAVFDKVIEILNPDVVIFLSSKAYYNCKNKNKENIYFEFTAHPSSPWWNRKSYKYRIDDSSALSGSEKFERLIIYSVLKEM